MLYTLGQEQLARLRFPLGDLPKSETRRIAADLGLGVADKPDSADICFVPGGDYRELLRDRGDSSRGGVIVDADGSTLRRHDGVAAFTVGQRRGLGVATGEKRYVTAIDAPTGTVRVGTADDLLADAVEASQPRWVGEAPRTRRSAARAHPGARPARPGAPDGARLRRLPGHLRAARARRGAGPGDRALPARRDARPRGRRRRDDRTRALAPALSLDRGAGYALPCSSGGAFGAPGRLEAHVRWILILIGLVIVAAIAAAVCGAGRGRRRGVAGRGARRRHHHLRRTRDRVLPRRDHRGARDRLSPCVC